MGDWSIQLKTAGLNGWIVSIEENLTMVKDFLDILEQEEKALKRVFDSEARLQWEKVFQDGIAEIREKMIEMEKITLSVEELAQTLTELEKSMVSEAEGFR
ncbi:hypothetical protein [Parablautia muri]|uniref:Uncharacterized protein n=1 Tax=Parablautia muri TaxID=2320879 RepID=A0A9X5BGW4_9FIRM|nr:hypothetical protein [Parablautia muri]NBJ93588.1 hypothetical protein [Parablautia muri]